MSLTHVPAEVRRQLAQEAGGRCGYCLSDETLSGVPLSIDHLNPEAAGGQTVVDNLWLACRPCNESKGAQTGAIDPATGEFVPLFNPRQQEWAAHFRWGEGGAEIIGLTPCGRATVGALHLNRPILVKARRRWINAGWHPPG